MALDGIFLYHLKNEIAQFAVGARIEKIHQPSKEELLLSLRSREGAQKLLLSCRADTAGIYFTSYPPEILQSLLCFVCCSENILRVPGFCRLSRTGLKEL